MLVFLKVFRGNRDHYSIKENSFDPPFRSRFVRVYARTWVNHISMRLEFYGGRACKWYFFLPAVQLLSVCSRIIGISLRSSRIATMLAWEKWRGGRRYFSAPSPSPPPLYSSFSLTSTPQDSFSSLLKPLLNLNPR